MQWLFDGTGAPIDVPATCAGFHARFWAPGARGLGEVVRDPGTGGVLHVPSTATAEVFRELVGGRVGRYRLTLVDRRGRPLRRSPEAIVVLGDEGAGRAVIGADALTQILARFDASDRASAAAADRLVEAMERLRRVLLDHPDAAVRAKAIAEPAAAALPSRPRPTDPPPRRARGAAPQPPPPPAGRTRKAANQPAHGGDPPSDAIAQARAMFTTAHAQVTAREATLAAAGIDPALLNPFAPPASASSPTPSPATPPLTDAQVRAQMAEVTRLVPPLPAYVLEGMLADPHVDVQPFRILVERARGDLAALAAAFTSREIATALLTPIAALSGADVAPLIARWQSRDPWPPAADEH